METVKCGLRGSKKITNIISTLLEQNEYAFLGRPLTSVAYMVGEGKNNASNQGKTEKSEKTILTVPQVSGTVSSSVASTKVSTTISSSKAVVTSSSITSVVTSSSNHLTKSDSQSIGAASFPPYSSSAKVTRPHIPTVVPTAVSTSNSSTTISVPTQHSTASVAGPSVISVIPGYQQTVPSYVPSPIAKSATMTSILPVQAATFAPLKPLGQQPRSVVSIQNVNTSTVPRNIVAAPAVQPQSPLILVPVSVPGNNVLFPVSVPTISLVGNTTATPQFTFQPGQKVNLTPVTHAGVLSGKTVMLVPETSQPSSSSGNIPNILQNNMPSAKEKLQSLIANTKTVQQNSPQTQSTSISQTTPGLNVLGRDNTVLSTSENSNAVSVSKCNTSTTSSGVSKTETVPVQSNIAKSDTSITNANGSKPKLKNDGQKKMSKKLFSGK